MRSIVFRKFGPPEVLESIEADEPVPARKQVRIRVHATTVTAAEAAMRRGEPLWGRAIIGFTGPRKRFRTLGSELAGVIDAIGGDVTRFKVGDPVFGFAGFNIGANADYLCLPEGASLALKPRNKTFGESAAAVDGATTAFFFLQHKAKLRPGQRVLVIGASGSIGTFAVQVAKRLGAHVTGVCGTSNLELVRSLGADAVIDYSKEDFTRSGDAWDIIFDTVGASSFEASRAALTQRGIFLPTVISVRGTFERLWTPLLGTKRLVSGMSVDKNAALVLLRDLLEADALRIVIERRFPLERIVEAHRLVDTRRKKGNVVVDLI